MSEQRYKVVKHKGDTCSHFLSREEAEKAIKDNGFAGCTVEPV